MGWAKVYSYNVHSRNVPQLLSLCGAGEMESVCSLEEMRFPFEFTVSEVVWFQISTGRLCRLLILLGNKTNSDPSAVLGGH